MVLSSRMAFDDRNSERNLILHDYRRQEEEVVGRLGSRPISPKNLLEHEKKIRREIANSNERRRMQSINAGFQSLRALLPHRKGEKLSKAAILQCTADYVYQLEEDKKRLLEQNSQLSRRMNSARNDHDSDGSCSNSPLPKRKKREPADSVDEGIGSSSPSRSESGSDDVKTEILELRHTLARERALRMLLEEQVRNLVSRSVINMGHESGLGSPQSQISSQDVESNHEISLRESSPDLSSTEIPEELSVKNNGMLLVCADDISVSDVATIPALMLPTSPVDVTSSPSYPVDISVTPKQETYKVSSRSRQNLETIVEAIKHVEGLDIFHGDDPKPVEQELSPSHKGDKVSLSEEQMEQTSHSLTKRGYSCEHQIIRNAPLAESRPGVIVSSQS